VTAHALAADVAAPRLSALALHRRHRQRNPHGLSHLPAVHPVHKGREPAHDRRRAHAGLRGRRRGKLVCAFIGARRGTTATVCLAAALAVLLILAILPLPLEAAMLILPVIGIALNDTSSVLYGSAPDKRTRAFGIFYTGTIGAGAIAPIFYGLAGDALGLTQAVVAVALIVLVTIPLALILRPALSHQRQSPSAA
jgi:MFS family permease